METSNAPPKAESGDLDVLSVRVEGDNVVFALGDDDLLQMGISEAARFAHQIGAAISRSSTQGSV